MNWLGAALILTATSWMGFELARRVRERPKQLRQLKVALQSLEAEILYGHQPLEEAFLSLSQQLSGPVALFFHHAAEALRSSAPSVQAAWTEALVPLADSSALKKAELEVLKQFGSTLGRHDRSNQTKQIHLTLAHLERELTEANEAQNTYEKMYKTLGVLGGLLLIIVLI